MDVEINELGFLVSFHLETRSFPHFVSIFVHLMLLALTSHLHSPVHIMCNVDSDSFVGGFRKSTPMPAPGFSRTLPH